MQTQNSSFRTLAILSVAMHIAVFVFVFVAFLMPPIYGAHFDKIIFYALTGSLIVPILFIMIMPLMPEKYPQLNPADSATPKPFYTALGEAEKKKARIFLDYQNITRRTFLMTVARLGMAECIAVVGFLVQFLYGNPIAILPYAAVALGLQIVFGPMVGRALSHNRPDTTSSY